MGKVFVGTAAWTLPPNAKAFFPAEGSHLERYSQVLNAVEINSSFYKVHLPESYARWATSVNDNFRFSVKLYRVFTHEKKFQIDLSEIEKNLSGVLHLGEALGVLLLQLPPSHVFEQLRVERFLDGLRSFYRGHLVCEPRHKSWADPAALELFKRYALSKVLADPEPCPVESINDWQAGEVVYFRLHGSPEIYKSDYSEKFLIDKSEEIKRWARKKEVWCIFDNTTFGHATENALRMTELTRNRA